MSRKYRTVFTPEGTLEPMIKCMGKCGETLPSCKFGFKYGIRNGIKGKIRNSNCLACKVSSITPHTKFETEVLSKCMVLEESITLLKNALHEERMKNKELEGLLAKFIS